MSKNETDKFSDIFECIERRFVLLSREFMSDLVINVEKSKQNEKKRILINLGQRGGYDIVYHVHHDILLGSTVNNFDLVIIMSKLTIDLTKFVR